MSQYLLFLVLGLSIGAVYAALTMGIVLTYQGAGIINFAAAAMATVSLYVFDDLTKGVFTLPLPWFPELEVGDMSVWGAAAIALLVAAALAALVEVGISRPLRKAPVLAKVAVAIGMMLTIQAAVALKYGTDARPRATILPTGSVKIGDASVAVDRLWLIGIVVVLGSALAIWFRRSRTGLAVQAAAENERAASFARLSPSTLGMVTWVVATVFIALVMIIAGPASGVISPNNLTLLVVPALAGALVARLSSLWIGLFAALILGAVQSVLTFLSQTKDWWPDWAQQGLTDAVPFIVIVIALFILGKSIPMRGDDTTSRLPPVFMPKNRPGFVFGFTAVGVLALVFTSGSYRFGVITSLAFALIALSVVLLTGMVGQISLAQVAFAGVAGLALSKIGDRIPFPFSMILAALIAMVCGVIVGLPALRIRGAQLAVVTLAAALTLEKFVFGNAKIQNATGNMIPDAKLLGIDLSVREGTNIARIQFGLFVLVVLVVTFILVGNLIRAGTGRKMLAVRSNERAAASMGIGVSGIKLVAFAMASFLAGLGGTLIGYSRGQISAESFGVFVGLSFFAIAYFSGITSMSGAVLAGVAGVLGIGFVIADRILDLGVYYPLISGISLILTVLLNPMGVTGKIRTDYDRFVANRKRKRVTVPDGGSELRVDHVEEAARRRRPAPVREIGATVLSAQSITVQYGGVKAVNNVSIDVRSGEIVGLIGPNGAGKTSFIDAITGFTASGGTVSLGDEDLSSVPAHQRARKGLVRTWQSVELFDDLSVESNVRVADDIGDDWRKLLIDSIRPNPAPSPAVVDAIEMMGLTSVAERKPAELSLGRQKALGVARALAMKPSVLLLDEPAAGLDTSESQIFGEHVQHVAASGVGCLLIDHDMHLMLGICDRIYVIEFGKPIADGTPEEVRRNPKVVAAYLGSDHVNPVVNDAESVDKSSITTGVGE